LNFNQENLEEVAQQQPTGKFLSLEKCFKYLCLIREDKVRAIVDEIMEKLPETFNMREIQGRVEERTPYVIVCFQVILNTKYRILMMIIYQECERMNILTSEMRRSLKELDLGLKGELTTTSDMEDLSNALFLDQVIYWIKL
jgi:dynein heavy chain